MLNLKRRPLYEIAPWLTSITPELILNKDGSLLATYEFLGVDADSPDSNDITSARNQLDQACRSFDNRITAWWKISHRRARSYIDGDFTAGADARLDALNRAHMTTGKYFHNTHSLALAYTPESGIAKFFDKTGYHMTVGGKSVIPAIFEATKDTLFARSAFAFDLEKLTTDARRFESMLDAFTGGVPRLRTRRLVMQDSYAVLHQAANPSVPPRRIRYPVTLLDTHLTESEVTVGSERLLFESAHGKRYAAIVAVKEWMSFQEAALDSLMQIDAELDVCIMYRFLDTARAAAYIEKVRRFYKMAALNVRAILKQYFAKEEAENDEGREELAKEAGKALKRLTAEGTQHGFANISIVVYGDTESALEDSVSEVVGALTNAGFGAIREKANLMPAWNSTLPGRWDKQRRLQFVETPAVSDLAPVRSVMPGPTRNAWLSDKAGKEVPPLTCLPTRHRTAQRVDLHQPGGNGHLLIIGPIGAGKSVFLNFLVSQAGRHDARRIRFDKDRSTRIPTLLSGGAFVDVTGKFQAATHVNPLSLLNSPTNFTYVTEWVTLALEDEDFSLSPQQSQDIFEAVKILATYPREHWTLGRLATLLHDSLRERLQIWLQGGQYGHFFDHAEDAFDVSDNLSIEMGDLFEKYPRAAVLFSDYAFYRISQSMDGLRYTIIEVEEAGFFFQHPRFYKRLETWITTIRKLNGAVWMATQSLRQLERVPDFEILKDNVGNLIYLPNSQANTSKDLYKDKFGLTDDQIQMINDAVPNRDYLWITRAQTRMLQSTFSDEMVAMLRSDGVAQSILDRHYASGATDWQQNYVREMLARSA
ncbi:MULTISPECIES: VirB4 family type IV secretion system protein [Cupriavidus]|uniref:Type IV secretory pathway, Conjugal transfer protein, putative ATPase n=1 Tax=Cupriavidus taiwanensis TaxID=164546 RepID=A0A7Z7JG23_9BURK|nr:MULTISPECIES: VirB4 family type IV secretion system protein [Cupriavidus]NOV26620.1 conjugal transfer protein [Cupriavidus necator]NSX13257.1 conjugal transfer protein [Cupriavidus taiwanensis]SOZ18896.1 Type IV secretory pathway, Conjugal transfer protein, putative ATPase [Cupriavidus taiwanensis]SOZ97013.1 Type IV secretory pathway, Conjugal transfer protein, putative ATPase [Cupriavidus taiwanensis]SPC25912.1 Type IV secretory pathway, Conjugal transfer protein, putative ATPase [Cupriavi